MRLLQIAPLTYLLSYGLPETNKGQAKNYLATGQNLKYYEQRLISLKRCKSQVFPKFILNEIKISDSMFPKGITPQALGLLFQLRTSCLNRQLEHTEDLIRLCKCQLCKYKHQLHQNISDQLCFMKLYTQLPILITT